MSLPIDATRRRGGFSPATDAIVWIACLALATAGAILIAHWIAEAMPT